MGADWEPGKTRRRTAVRLMRARHKEGSAIWFNLCQKAVRTALGAGPGAASAKRAWLDSDREDRRAYREDKPPPFGVPVYFKMNTPYWHVALSAGRGKVWTTDVVRRGRVDKVSIAYIERRWNARCIGWLTTINGRRIW
jgi:hypothetical protein